MKKKIILYITAMVLLFTVVAGATFAYLFSNADAIENVFSPSYIGNPVVTETNRTYSVQPGVAITKDPKVQYVPESDKTNVGSVVLFATLKLDGDGTTNWTKSSTANTFTFSKATSKTLSFTVDTNWAYVGKTASGLYVFAINKVLDGTTSSTNYPVIKSNRITVGTLWEETDLDKVFASGAVKITVNALVAQAQLDSTAVAVGDTVDATKGKLVWNACSTDDI